MSGPLSDAAEAGVRIDEADRRASEGKVAVVGVVRDGSLGLVEIGIVNEVAKSCVYVCCCEM